MINYTSRPSSGKGEVLTASHERGQATTKALSASPLPTTDGMNKLYHQWARDSCHCRRKTGGVRSLTSL
jgi:hypothetical protein